MTKLTRKRTILVKIEVTEGTDPVPTGAANAILISEPTIQPLAGGTVQRNTVKNTLGADAAIHVNTHVVVGFMCDIAGAGAVAVAPAYGPLLRMCGTAETITPTTGPVEYDPVSTDGETGTIYFNVDGIRHALLGARGNVSLTFPPNDIPRFEFTFTGLFVAPTDTAAPALTLGAFKDPLPVSKVNTPTFTLHGYAGVLESLSLNLGNQVEHRDRVGSARVLRTDRQGGGNVALELPTIAAKDFISIAKANTLGALQLIHGVGAGNIIQIDAPAVQLTEPSYDDSQGITTLSAGLILTPNAGDDELKITVK